MKRFVMFVLVTQATKRPCGCTLRLLLLVGAKLLRRPTDVLGARATACVQCAICRPTESKTAELQASAPAHLTVKDHDVEQNVVGMQHNLTSASCETRRRKSSSSALPHQPTAAAA